MNAFANRPSLLVITTYPPKGTIHSDKTVGGAYYAKSILEELKHVYPRLSITVLAEVFDEKVRYEENGITVQREWERENTLSIVRSFITAYKKSAPDILVSFEAYMFGNPHHTLTAFVCLLLLKLAKRNISLVLHQVPSNLHIRALNVAKSILYPLILFISDRVIVFEEQFRENLGNHRKVTVIPLFIPRSSSRITKQAARAKLGIAKSSYVVLYFGFIAPYKGIDWLVKTWPKQRNVSLLVAGGENPNHAKDTSYKAFVQEVLKQAQQKHIQTTSFVVEKTIPYYFSSADTIILPYRIFLSSSGPLSLGLSFEKGVLLSKELAGYQRSADFQWALARADVSMKDITFAYKKSDLLRVLNFAKNNQRKLKRFARLLRKKRTKRHAATMLYQTINKL